MLGSMLWPYSSTFYPAQCHTEKLMLSYPYLPEKLVAWKLSCHTNILLYLKLYFLIIQFGVKSRFCALSNTCSSAIPSKCDETSRSTRNISLNEMRSGLFLTLDICSVTVICKTVFTNFCMKREMYKFFDKTWPSAFISEEILTIRRLPRNLWNAQYLAYIYIFYCNFTSWFLIFLNLWSEE